MRLETEEFETFVPKGPSSIEEAKLIANVEAADAALEFIPEGEPVPYDAGSAGMLFEEPEPTSPTFKRCDALRALGLKFNGQEYCKDDFNIHTTEITCDTDEEFDAKVARIKAEMKRREDEVKPKSVAEIIAGGDSNGLFEAIKRESNVVLPRIADQPPAAESINIASAALPIPTELNGLAIHHGKILTKEEIKRILDGYRAELEVFGSPYDETLKQLEAIGEAKWTAADVEQAADINRYYQKHRTALEHHRKTLKEKSLRTGQFIDGAANIVKAHCENREARAKAIVQHEARKAALARALLTEARELALAPFVESVKTYDVGGMSEEAFAAVLAGCKLAHELEQTNRLEAERVAAVEAQKREAENAAAKVKLARVQQLSSLGFTYHEPSHEYGIFEGSLCIHEDEIENLDDAAWANLIAATEADITHLRAKQIEEEREAAAAKAEIARKAEEERCLAAAPEKEKLLAFARGIEAFVADHSLITDANQKSRYIEETGVSKLWETATWLKTQAEAL